MRPDGKLAEALSACGIDPNTVEVGWEDELQADVMTFDDGTTGLSEEALDGLAQIHLDFGLHMEMEAEDYARFRDALERNPQHQEQFRQARADMQAQGITWLTEQGMADFAPYAPQTESLADFAARVEATLGVAAGGVLEVTSDHILVRPDAGSLSFPQFQTLLALLSQGDADWGVLSEDGEEEG